MRLCSFTSGGRAGFGAFTARGLAELTAPDCPDLRTALATRSPAQLRLAAETATIIDTSQHFTYLPPIPVPDKILAVGLNYRTHLAETNTPIPSHPAFFIRTSAAQVGHLQPIVAPANSPMFDFEGELAVIIGRTGRHIAEADAMQHVAGYACFADNSVRDFQRHSTQATPGKNFERSGGFGPWLITADEIPDLTALYLTTRLNGVQVQHTGLDDLLFSVEAIIAYASSFCRLLPGDVIATGTPGGVGMARTPPLWMRPGDELEVEVSGIGILRNPVIAEPIAQKSVLETSHAAE